MTKIQKHANRAGLLGFVALLLVIALAFSGCGTHRKLTPTTPPQSEPIGAAGQTPYIKHQAPDTSNVVVQNPRTLLDKVLGRKPPVAVYPAGTPIKTGKKSTITINNVTGGQTNTTNTAGKNATAGTGATGGGKAGAPVAGTGGTATSIEKAKAPVVVGTGDATDNTKAGQRGGAAATGANSTATATTIKPPTPWLKYGLWVLGAVGGYWLLFGGGGAVLLALWRRNKSTSTQA